MERLELTADQTEAITTELAKAEPVVDAMLMMLRSLRVENGRLEATAVSASVIEHEYDRDTLVTLLQVALEKLADTQGGEPGRGSLAAAFVPVAPEWGNGGYV